MNPDWRVRYERAVEIAHRASRVAQRYFESGLAVEWKKDRTPVTAADRETEALLRTQLLGAFPEDGFLGEESGDTPGGSGYRWIIDPIDGTRNFMRGIPIWGTLVGLEYRGELIAGVVEAPALGQSWRALRGGGAYRGDQQIRVSQVDRLADATLFHTSYLWFVKAGRGDDFVAMSRQAQVERGYGDFWGHMLVAQGSGEVMVEHGVNPWDMAALAPIVEEAGGRFSDWSGTPTIYKPDVLTTNGALHETALRLLTGKSSNVPGV